jgi:hypothetical protein
MPLTNVNPERDVRAPVSQRRDRSAWLQRCMLAAIGLGLALRAYHYGRNPSVWHDEAALILNVLGKSFVGLLGPLYFAEAGPPLFLWLERAIRLLLGDGVFPLRFLPFAASCLALAMVAATARRLLRPAAAPIAVLLFACSRSLLWHASEAKPYALDIALAALVPMLICGPMRRWSVERKLVGFGLLGPVVIMLSYPGCFLMGGIGLSLLPEVWRSRRRSAWLACLFFHACVGAAFLVLFLGPIHAQRCANMEACWVKALAPWDRPWRLPLWTLESILGLPRYCLDPQGDLLIVPAVIGFVSFYRSGKGAIVVLLAAPVALAFAAACVHAYPFNASRVIAFAAPALVLSVAQGSIVLGRWLYEPSRFPCGWARIASVATLVLFLLLPLGRAIGDTIWHWPRADVAATAQFVMKHREKADLVIGNQWEHAYYFRSLRKEFVLWDGRPLPDVPRFWFVVSAGTDTECELLTAIAMRDRWHPAMSKRFEHCHAILMVRNETLVTDAR